MEEMNMTPQAGEHVEGAVWPDTTETVGEYTYVESEDIVQKKCVSASGIESDAAAAEDEWNNKDCEQGVPEPMPKPAAASPEGALTESPAEEIKAEDVQEVSEDVETAAGTYHYPSLVSLESRVLEYNELAIRCTGNGNYDKALKYMNQAVELQKKDGGEMTGRMISLLGNIAKIYYLKGDQQTWLSYGEKILEMKKKVYGIDHEQTADSFEDLGKVYLEMDKPIKGLVFLERALEIRRKVLGDYDASTADVLDTVGACYMKAEIAEGLELREKALDIRIRTLGQEHEKTAKSYDELGDCYWNAGDVLLGLEYKEKAADVRIKLGLESLDISESYRLLSGYCEETDKKERALYYLRKAVAIRVKLLPEADEELREDYELLSRYCSETRDTQGALEYTRLAKKVKRALTWRKRLPWKRRKHKIVEE